MRAFITGIAGFAGRHLAAHLLSEGWDVHGLVRHGDGRDLPATVTLHPGDLSDADSLEGAIGAARPEAVFHLAAQASVPASWQDPVGTYATNVLGQAALLEALARAPGTPPRVLVVSSNEVYGAPVGPEELPVREDNPLRPSNPYAVSKAAQDLMGYQYAASGRLPVVRVRPFNHIGPGQSDAYVAGAFARQVAEIEAHRSDPVIRVGNLEARRDFTDVRDTVRAYRLALLHGPVGAVYNIASGRPVAVRALLDYYLSQSPSAAQVERDPERYRPVDVPEVYGDSTRLYAATGWVPAIPLEATLRDVLEYWRASIRT